MPPRMSLLLPRRLPVRAAPRSLTQNPIAVQSRYASNDSPAGRMQEKAEDTPSGGNESKLGHVTEEQAEMDKIMGEVPPQTDEQSTPLQDILARDEEAQKHAPQVFKQNAKKPTGGQSRSFSTSARRLALETQSSNAADSLPESMLVAQNQDTAAAKFEETRIVGLEYPDAGPGHKFALPVKDVEEWKNWPITNHLRRRYDPVVDQVTKMLMRDGKLARAQKDMEYILNTLRTAPAPSGTLGRTLLTDAGIATNQVTLQSIPRSALPLSPIQYLTSAIDSVAPLITIRQQSGVLGGGANMPIPYPLRVKQRRHTAIKWILASSEKRNDIKMADRVAKEIIAVAQGKSGVWEKRSAVHKQGITARSNVRSGMQQKRSKVRLPITSN